MILVPYTTEECKPVVRTTFEVSAIPYKIRTMHPGPKVRQFRKAANISLDDLAAETGWDKGNLSKFENGKLGYSHPSLEKLAAKLGRELWEFFTDMTAEDVVLAKVIARSSEKTKIAAQNVLLQDREEALVRHVSISETGGSEPRIVRREVKGRKPRARRKM